MEHDVIRQLGNMMQMIGQGATQAARGNATANATPQLSANAAFLEQGQIEVANADGTYEVFIHSQGQRLHASACTDEPLEEFTVVWVSLTETQEWVIHGSVK
jgi:hypothetical protein